jgi:hypothetical protein
LQTLHPAEAFRMRSDIVPGAVCPTTDSPTHCETAEAVQFARAIILVLSCGGFCPKDCPQAEGLVQLHRELQVGCCGLVTISTDNIAETNAAAKRGNQTTGG